MKNKYTILFSGAALFALLFLAACSKDNAPGKQSTNSYLISATQAGEVQPATLQTLLAADPGYGYAKYASLPKTHVTLYRVSYKTQYPEGKTITASGVFFIPDNYNAALPAVVYTHGTIGKGDTPSAHLNAPLNYTMEVMLCAVACSSFGCAVVMPDYVGYGDSQSIVHPYIHGQSLGQASFDMVQAFREYAAKAGLPFDGQLLITGYSEGGYAAVALQKKVQESSGSGLHAVKTVAGSGPYDNVAFAQELLSQNAPLDPTMMATYLWAMYMYKTDFGYSKSYAQIFSDADNALLQSTGYNLAYLAPVNLTALDTNPAQLFRPEFISGVVGDTGTGTDTEFLNILSENSLTDFAPADSLVLVCGSADNFVYPVNTLNAYNAMHDKGCKVQMYEFTGTDHDTTLPCYLDILLGRLEGLQ